MKYKEAETSIPTEQEEKLDKLIELSDYKRGYIAGKRYYEKGPVDMKVHLKDVPDEITQEVVNWFVNYAPVWGVTLQGNTWQYHLANYFYNLGVSHEREALLKLREEAMQKYNPKLDEILMEHPLTPDECNKKV